MIYLNAQADSVLPPGLAGTPFDDVFKAIQRVAAETFNVEPRAWRAAVAWGWYLLSHVEILSDSDAAASFLPAVLVSESAPLVKDDQTAEDLALLLSLWREYTPTFERLEGLYAAFAATVDVRPVTDDESRGIVPLPEDAKNAFYVVIKDVDWSRPLLLSEAETIARRATPLGALPVVYYGFEQPFGVFAGLAYGDAASFVGADAPATYDATNVYGSMSKTADGSISKVASAGSLKMPLDFKSTTPDYALYAIRLPSASALTEHRTSYARSLYKVFGMGLIAAGALVDDWVNTGANFLYYENRETLYYETLTEASAVADRLNTNLYSGSAPFYVELFDGGFFGFVKK